MSEVWDTLGIEETDNLELIKEAYSTLLKKFKPQDHPQEFIKIRRAYEEAISFIHDKNEINCNSAYITDNVIKYNECNVNDLDYIYSKIMDVYYSDSNNSVSAWENILSKYAVEITGDESFGLKLIDNIIQKQYLYRSDFYLQADIYILLFDFFGINERLFIPNVFHDSVCGSIMPKIRNRRFSLRQDAIVASKFNQYSPYKQARAEFLISEDILSHSLDSIVNKGVLLNTIKHASDHDLLFVFRQVMFRYILDQYLSDCFKVELFFVGYVYDVFRMQRHKKSIIKSLICIGYHPQEVINGLNFCRKQYEQLVRPYKLLWRFIMNPLAFVFGALKFILSLRIQVRSPIVKKNNN